MNSFVSMFPSSETLLGRVPATTSQNAVEIYASGNSRYVCSLSEKVLTRILQWQGDPTPRGRATCWRRFPVFHEFHWGPRSGCLEAGHPLHATPISNQVNPIVCRAPRYDYFSTTMVISDPSRRMIYHPSTLTSPPAFSSRET